MFDIVFLSMEVGLCFLLFFRITSSLIDDYGFPKGDYTYLISDSNSHFSSLIKNSAVDNKTSEDAKPSSFITKNSVVLLDKDGASLIEENKFAAISKKKTFQPPEEPKEHENGLLTEDNRKTEILNDNTAVATANPGDLITEQTENEIPETPVERKTSPPQEESVASAIVVVGCKRVDTIINIALALLKQPEIKNYSMFLSLGCLEFLSKSTFQNVQALSSFTILEYDDAKELGYIPQPFKRIQLHYRFFLHTLFESYHFNRVIILEDDLEVSNSLLQFFEATSPLLDQDETIACISAYNDNAVADNGDSRLLRRSSYFPNLALMFSLRSYNIIWKDQPLDKVTNGWDHWLRIRAATLHMEGVFPVVPRVRHGCTSNSTTAQAIICRKLKVYPLSTERDLNMGDMRYILNENYDRFLLSQFFDPNLIDQAIQLFQLSEEILLKENQTIPDFNPSYQSHVHVELYKHSAVATILKPSNVVNVLLVSREVNFVLLVPMFRN